MLLYQKTITRILLVLTLWLNSFTTVFPQGNQYSVTSFTPVQGLASSDVSALFQDSKNYLWIAHAAGISRYDGEFKNYLFSGETRLGRAFSIYEEKDRFWIGAEGGLFLISGNELKFIKFKGKVLPVYNITADNNMGLWICTSDGPAHLTRADIETMTRKGFIDITAHIAKAWKQQFPLTNTSIKLSIDPAGSVFVSDGVSVYKLEANAVHELWESKHRADQVTGLLSVKEDQIYFTSTFTGLHKVEKGKHINVNSKLTTGNDIISHKGQLYYYSTEGVYHVDPVTNNISTVVMLPEKYWEWGSCVLKDNENNFWIGTHEKLLQARKNLFSDLIQPASGVFDELYSVVQSKNGDLLVGLNQGRIFRKRLADTSFLFNNKIFNNAPVSDMLETVEGEFWYGSHYQGIALNRNGKTKIFTTKDGLRDDSNFFLLYTSSKQMYTGGDNGITKIIKDKNGGISFKNFSLSTGSTHYPIFRKGIERPDGNPLFGGSFGLYELVNDSLQPVQILNSARKNFYVTDMVTDANGLLWISTMGDGILVCSFEKNALKMQKQFGEKDGLASMIYLDVLVDNKQIIWAAGHAGITMIESNKGYGFIISNFDQTHGFINDNYHSIKMYQDRNNLIWIPTSSGLFHFNPAEAMDHTRSLSVEIVNVLDENNKEPIQTISEIRNKTEASLSYHVNDLYFEFSSIHLSDPSGVKYRYRLMGSDTNWKDAGNNRYVSFRNLAPGSYTFEVQASSGSNQWSKTATYGFSILSPFWTRWWFIASTLLLIAAISVYVIRRREKKIRQREAEKTELQKLKTISYQYKLEIEQVTNFFATSISKQRTVDDILWDVARNCISKLGFEDCVIYLKDERNVLVQKAAWGPKTTEENKINNPIEIQIGKGIVGSVAESGKPIIINDTSLDPRYIVDDVRRDAEISVPIKQNGVVTGVIDCEHSQKNFYNEKHLQILSTIASLCADRMDKVIAEQRAREKEVEVFKLNQDLATSQLTALRSQMNPHFIFNSLNSIAQLVASKQNEEGLEYLTKFSKLLRIVLDVSSDNFISLKDEVKILDLYLQLESLRFDSAFNYTIHLDEDLDDEEVMLPSFLIHPVVENAVWHGLLHKAGDRRLVIHFVKKTEEILHCIIKDNGIGIDAAILKKKNQINGDLHPSKGLRLVTDRLALLQQQYGIQSWMHTEDMKDGEGFESGTKVTIQLPVIYE